MCEKSDKTVPTIRSSILIIAVVGFEWKSTQSFQTDRFERSSKYFENNAWITLWQLVVITERKKDVLMSDSRKSKTIHIYKFATYQLTHRIGNDDDCRTQCKSFRWFFWLTNKLALANLKIGSICLRHLDMVNNTEKLSKPATIRWTTAGTQHTQRAFYRMVGKHTAAHMPDTHTERNRKGNFNYCLIKYLIILRFSME